MDAAAGIGRSPATKSTRFILNVEMTRLTRDWTAEPVSRDQILRRERGQENIDFPCSADHEQDWQPYLVDIYSAVISENHKCVHCVLRLTHDCLKKIRTRLLLLLMMIYLFSLLSFHVKKLQ